MMLLLSRIEADCLSSQHRKQLYNLNDTPLPMRSLYRASGLVLGYIEDPRAVSNDFREMLVIAICASLCDMDTCEDFALWAQARQPWLQRFLTLKNGIPSSATFYRLFRALNAKQFEAFFRR